MLFWNNDIKAVVVVGTNIADNELQHEYTVGIFPILRTPYRWVCVAVHSKSNYRLVCGPFLLTQRERQRQRDTQRDRDRQTDRDRQRQRDRDREIR